MKIKYPIIVEGKYDKIKLDSLVESTVITTGGFEIFNSKEKELLLKRLCQKDKIILLTDSDGGGHLIRSHIKTVLPPDKIINLYIPRVQGKEKRKKAPSKEGTLGVEGIEKETLLKLLEPFSDTSPTKIVGGITKSDLYFYGLSGRQDSAKMREIVLKELNLPTNMSPNAMLSAINILYTKEEFEEIINKIEY
jgi:ribonuclease M5